MAKKKTETVSRWKDPQKRASYIFIAGVFVLSIVSFWITNQDFFNAIAQPILNVYAKISSFLINIFGYSTRASGELLISKSFSLEIRKGCDAIAPMLLYTFAILFFPTEFKNKPKAILFGLILLFALNLVRIVSLFFTKEFFPSLFGVMHTEVWQILFIAFTLFIWLRWLKNTAVKPVPNV